MPPRWSPDRLHSIFPAPGETLQFVTQGDANAVPDPHAVPAPLVRGRVPWSVSHLGTALDWLQWPRSFLLLVVGPAVGLAGLELRTRSTRVASRDAIATSAHA